MNVRQLGYFGDDAGGWHWISGRGWVFFPPFNPNLDNPKGGLPPSGSGGRGLGGGFGGDPRIDGGWRPWEHVLLYLDALRESLDDKSNEAFRKALASEEHIATVARLYNKQSCAMLETRLSTLQHELHRPGADKQAILKQITAVLEQMQDAGC